MKISKTHHRTKNGLIKRNPRPQIFPVPATELGLTNETLVFKTDEWKSKISKGARPVIQVIKTNRGLAVADGNHRAVAYHELGMLPIAKLVKRPHLKKLIESGQMPLERVGDYNDIDDEDINWRGM